MSELFHWRVDAETGEQARVPFTDAETALFRRQEKEWLERTARDEDERRKVAADLAAIRNGTADNTIRDRLILRLLEG